MEAILKTFDLTLLDAQMIGVCIVLFVIYWKGMEACLARPFMTLAERREAATSGSVAEAGSLGAQAEKLEAEVEAALTEARIQAMRERLGEVGAAKKRAAQTIHDAEAAAQQTAKNARAEIEQRLGEIRARVMSDADQMAQTISDRLKSPRKENSGARKV